ncbi:hypothetical protein FQN57_001666 [Myotisia sp. PD_48]|nr:hypothetical protein FQN57_001666 [Myotisia sp. PD_48]
MPRLAPVAILGAGTQGRRLAYMWSSRGSPVHLIDQHSTQLADALQAIDKFRENARNDLPLEHTGGEVKCFTIDQKENALENAWLVVECVPESLKLKRSVIQELENLTSGDTIIASNSSSFTITEIMHGLTLRHADRFVSLHSIWAAIKRESLLVAAEGVATPEEIDAIYKDVLKTPKGPFEQMDVVGLDVVLDIEEHYAEERAELPTEPREYLRKIVAEGKLGVKNGKGFYQYEKTSN